MNTTVVVQWNAYINVASIFVKGAYRNTVKHMDTISPDHIVNCIEFI